MTGSRADRRWRAAAVIALATATVSFVQAPALAQSGGPVSLVPPPADQRVREEDGRAPDIRQRQGQPAGILRSVPGTGDSSVQIRGLGEVDTDAVGLSQSNAGGLSADMWRGTSRAVAERLLTAVPERLASGAAHDLARRLLLNAAEPPASTRGEVSLVKLRVDKLIALGAAEDAGRLLRAVSARSVPQNLIESAVHARLLTPDYDGACQAVATFDAGFVSEFGQKALVFCQLLKQETSEAVLGLELLREQNLAQDTIFFELANAVVSGATPTEEQLAAPGQASALNLALMRLAGAPVPSWFADADAPSVLRAVAITPNADREIRLTAARRAAMWGALSPAELADIYTGLGIGADEIAAVLLEPESASAGLRLAVIYLAVESQKIAVARAEVLREMWRIAAEQQDWRLAAKLTAPQLRLVQPAPIFLWLAGDAMAVSLAAGEVEQALDWFQTADGRSAGDEAAANALTAIWPALRMAAGGDAAAQTGGAQARVFDQSGRRNVTTIPGATNLTTVRRSRLPWDARRLADWMAMQEVTGAQGAASVATILALFDALGEPVPDAFWQRAEAAEPVSTAFPALDVWIGLQRAANAGNVAETALYALLVVGEDDVSQLHPVAIHSVVAALRRVGLSDAARAIALEVAVTSAP
jgi:hypothetical protein